MTLKNAVIKNLSIAAFYGLACLLAVPAYNHNSDWGGWLSVAGVAAIGTVILVLSLMGKADK